MFTEQLYVGTKPIPTPPKPVVKPPPAIKDLRCNIGSIGSSNINLTWQPLVGANSYTVTEASTGERKVVYTPKFWFNSAVRGKIYQFNS